MKNDVNLIDANTDQRREARDEAIKMLCLCSEQFEGRAPSYSWWSKNIKSPSAAGIIILFGSWSQAVKKAGLAPNSSPRENYTSKWNWADVRAAVLDYVQETGSTRIMGYAEWAKLDSTRPSLGTVRSHMRKEEVSWASLIQTIS